MRQCVTGYGARGIFGDKNPLTALRMEADFGTLGGLPFSLYRLDLGRQQDADAIW